ncbi:hypothetical protein ACUL41_03430 [Virgibacillus natechei]
MNEPEAKKIWFISNKRVEEMDFSDKETKLGDIHNYGYFEEFDPDDVLRFITLMKSYRTPPC